MSDTDDWERDGRELLFDLINVKPEERRSEIMRRVGLLPSPQRELVQAYVTGVFLSIDSDSEVRIMVSKHKTMVVILSVICLSSVIMFLAGLWLVGNDGKAGSDISAWGLRVKTDSVGIGMMCLSVVLILFSARPLIKRL